MISTALSLPASPEHDDVSYSWPLAFGLWPLAWPRRDARSVKIRRGTPCLQGVSGPKGSSFPVRGQTLFVLKDPILGSFKGAHEIAFAALFVLTEKNQVI